MQGDASSQEQCAHRDVLLGTTSQVSFRRGGRFFLLDASTVRSDEAVYHQRRAADSWLVRGSEPVGKGNARGREKKSCVSSPPTMKTDMALRLN